MPKTKKMWRFTVEGRLSFPVDMLRYGQCWPETGLDVRELYDALQPDRDRRLYSVSLLSDREPTAGRWASFSWRVTKSDRY